MDVTPRRASSVEVARGLLLLGVLHIHAMYVVVDQLGHVELAHKAQWQIKALAPHVALYFALAGMTSRSLGDKTWPVVVQRSLLLLLLALFSHALGVLIEHATWKPWTSAVDMLVQVARPIVEGTDYSTFVAWFFVVLAITRLFAFALARSWPLFAAALVCAAALVLAARWLGLPENVYEWRNWPAALVLFWLGTRIAPAWRVPHAVGVVSVVAGLALTLANRPAVWSDGVCFTCDSGFVAQPMIGSYGSMPLYFLQEGIAFIGLLWIAQSVATLPAGRILAYVGRRSMPLLLLHGWVILSLYGLIAYVLPHHAGVWLFGVIFAVNTVLHLALYWLLRELLDRFIALCSDASHRLMLLPRAVRRASRRGDPLSPPN